MTAERATYLSSLRDTPAPFPPIRWSYDHPSRIRCRVSELTAFVDGDGRSCWVDTDPWPLILEERRLTHRKE